MLKAIAQSAQEDSSSTGHLMGWLRGFLVIFVVVTVGSLLLLGVTAQSFISSMGILFMRDQVTGMAGVQLWVVLTTLLLVVRFLLDFFGPWSTNIPMMSIIRTIQMLNYSLVHYTLGLMQLSATRPNDYFQVWAVLLVTLQYSVKIGRPYNRSKMTPLLDLMSSFWTANLLRVQTFVLLKIPLWLTWALNAARIISYFASTEKAQGINQESNRFIADYMSYEHELSVDAAEDKEFTMEGYKYMVLGEDQVLKGIQEGRFATEQTEQEVSKRRRRVIRLHPTNCKDPVTVDKIWHGLDCGSLGGTADGTSRLKDMCLSFALYKLLRRRFYDLPVHEARLRKPLNKIRRLVTGYILQNQERVFRIISMELSFLQDLFYSKHAAMFANGFPITNMVLSLSLLTSVGYIAYPIRYIPERMDPADGNKITHGVFTTHVIIFLITFKELAEIYLYVFSQWTKLLILCSHVKHKWIKHWPVKMAMRVVLCLMNRGTWDGKIHQHNLLISTRGIKTGKDSVISFPCKFPASIKLKECSKEAIFTSLQKLVLKLEEQEKKQKTEPEKKQKTKKTELEEQEKQQQTDLEKDQDKVTTELDELEKKQKMEREKEQERKQKIELEKERVRLYISSSACCLLPEFDWALEFEGDTHKIIVWHIATCLCEIELASDKFKLRPSSLPPRPFFKPESFKSEQHAGKSWENYLWPSFLRLKPFIKPGQQLSPTATEQHGTNNDDAAKLWEHYATAASLSNYCMYLVSKALVPDNGIVARKVFWEVQQEINYIILAGLKPRSMQESFFEKRSMEDLRDRLMDTETTPERSWKEGARKLDIANSLTRKGARLATQLVDKFGKDEAGRRVLWKQLAEFWTGFLLYLAVSTRASKHKAHLAGRRELTTHLWALLSHAGFLGSAAHGHTSLDVEDLEITNPNS